MKRIRIGNNIAITWLLYEDDGNIHNLEGKELELYMTCGGLKFVVTDYTVTENAIAWVFPAQMQTRTGYYKLVLLERDQQRGLYSFDVAQAFCIEPKDALTNIETILDEDAAIQIKSVLTYAHITNLASIDTVESGTGYTAVVHLTNGKSFTIPIGSGGGSSVNVVDNLNSNSSSDALSAKQGKVLKGLIDAIDGVDVVDNLTSTSTASALSANMGRVLKGLIDSIEPGGGYTLPIASTSQLGGIKVGSGLTINSSTGVLSVTGGGSGGGSDVETKYSNVESNPGTPDTSSDNWHPNKALDDVWMAVRFSDGSSWGAWNIIYISTNISPYAFFKAFAFTRSNASSVSTPSGGSYASPTPTTTGWEDGVPSGTGTIWMSTRTFASDDIHSDETWSTPTVLADNEFMDYEFSAVANPGDPAKSSPSANETNPNWSNAATTGTIWMAMREVKNGAYATGSTWMVVKIKGENGQDGTSVAIKGSVNSVGDLPSSDNTVGDGYILSTNGHLYVWDGDSWVDCGQIKGDDGDDGQTPYIHIKYSDDGTTFTSNSGEDPGNYIGIYTDYNPTDSTTFSDYTWHEWRGEDGFGYEYIFKTTSTDTAPSLPSTSTDEDGDVPTGWTDDPGIGDPDYPYCWVAWRKKSDGHWSSWYGTTNNKARLYAHWGTDGYNTAIVYLYKRSSTAATIDWSSTLTYYFASKAFASVPTGWSATIPVNDGNPLYVTAATAASRGSSDTIAYTEWSTPVVLSEDGIDGLNSATILLYKRASSTPSVPGGTLTYTFADGSLSGNLGGWTKTVPPTDGNPCYCTQATAISTGSTDTILSSEWSSPELILQDGQDGSSALFPFVGEFTTAGTYYGNPSRTDIVKYNGYYYIAKTDAPTDSDGKFSGSASGATPGTTNSSYWIKLNSYANVATDTLFADYANVANFIFRSGKLFSSYEDGEGQAYLILDGTNGKIFAMDATIYGEVNASSGKIGPFEVGYDTEGDFNYLRSELTDSIVPAAGKFNRETDFNLDERGMSVSFDAEKATDSSVYSTGTFKVAVTSGSRGFVDINYDQTVSSPYNGAPHYDCGLKVTATGTANAIEAVGDIKVDGTIRYRKKVINVTASSYTFQKEDSCATYLVTGSATPINITLPNIAPADYDAYNGIYYDFIVARNTTGNAVIYAGGYNTITAVANGQVGSAASVTISNGHCCQLLFFGGAWYCTCMV